MSPTRRRLTPRASFRVLALVLCASWGSVGHAAEPSVDDVRHAGDEFNLGRTAFKAEDYPTAAEHFEKADSLVPNPKVLLLAIQARDRAGHASRAATLAALAQDRYPDDASFVPTRGLITAALDDNAKLRVTCNPPCNVLIDSRLVHGEPASKRFIFLEPGQYTVRAAWASGNSEARPFTAAAGQSGKLDFTGQSSAPVAAAEDDWGDEPASDALPTPKITYEDPNRSAPVSPSAGWSPTVFWVGVGLTVTGAAVSTWSGISAQNDPGPDRVREECVGQGESCSLFQQGKDAELRTNVLWGVTAGVGIFTILTGALWTDWGSGDSGIAEGSGQAQRSPRSVRVEPWLSVGDAAASVGARGRF